MSAIVLRFPTERVRPRGMGVAIAQKAPDGRWRCTLFCGHVVHAEPVNGTSPQRVTCSFGCDPAFFDRRRRV